MKIAESASASGFGSGSGSISQRHESAVSDPHQMSWIRNTGHRDNLRKIGIHLVKVRAPGIFVSSSLLVPKRIRIFLMNIKKFVHDKFRQRLF
jgi:hypothetical protein